MIKEFFASKYSRFVAGALAFALIIGQAVCIEYQDHLIMGLGDRIAEKNEVIEKLENQIAEPVLKLPTSEEGSIIVYTDSGVYEFEGLVVSAPDPGEDDVPGRNLIFYMPYAELKGENEQ